LPAVNNVFSSALWSFCFISLLAFLASFSLCSLAALSTWVAFASATFFTSAALTSAVFSAAALNYYSAFFESRDFNSFDSACFRECSIYFEASLLLRTFSTTFLLTKGDDATPELGV